MNNADKDRSEMASRIPAGKTPCWENSAGSSLFGARYYDGRTSVWESTDPAVGSYFLDKKATGRLYQSASLSLYAYGRMNPIRFLDPDGNKDYQFDAYEISKQPTIVTVGTQKFLTVQFYAVSKNTPDAFARISVNFSQNSQGVWVPHHAFEQDYTKNDKGEYSIIRATATTFKFDEKDTFSVRVLLGHRAGPDGTGGEAKKYESYDLINGGSIKGEYHRVGDSKTYKFDPQKLAHPGATLPQVISEQGGAPDHDPQVSTIKQLQSKGIKIEE